jgi:hypothetical protein
LHCLFPFSSKRLHEKNKVAAAAGRNYRLTLFLITQDGPLHHPGNLGSGGFLSFRPQGEIFMQLNRHELLQPGFFVALEMTTCPGLT